VTVRKLSLCPGRGFQALTQRVVGIAQSVGIAVSDCGDETSDAVAILGLDRDVLRVHAEMRVQKPIFVIEPPGYSIFYASTPFEHLFEALSRLATGSYRVEEVRRLRAVIDRSETVYALNEVAVFPSRSAVTMEYRVSVDGSELWRDVADGVIVASQTGSTAYAFSAGGPILLRGVEAYVIVPVNSMDPSKRAVVVPSRSITVIDELVCRTPCEVIADGSVRKRVSERVEVTYDQQPALFIKLSLEPPSEIKRRLIEELRQLPPSAKYVLKMLELYGDMTASRIAELTGLPPRTVRHALAVLVKRGLVKRIPSPENAKKFLYRAVTATRLE